MAELDYRFWLRLVHSLLHLSVAAVEGDPDRRNVMLVVRRALDQWQVSAAVHRVTVRVVVPHYPGHQLCHMRSSVGITRTKEIRIRDHEVLDTRSYFALDPGHEGIYPEADRQAHFVEGAHCAGEIGET